MEESRKKKRRNLAIVSLLLLLTAAVGALGVNLIARKDSARTQVDIPLSALRGESGEEKAPPEEEDTSWVFEETFPRVSNAVTSGQNKTEQTQKATLLQLYKRNNTDNVPFYVTNMFPGDRETQYFCVRVAHSHTVTLHFRADVRPGYETLAKALRCTVKRGDTVLYDGLMADMPAFLDSRLPSARRVTQDVVYEISAYLDTFIGNEYQNQELWADFRWWIEEKDELDDLPRTGDDFHLILFSTVAALSLLGLLALLVVLGRKDRRLARLLGTLIVLALLLSALFVTAYAATRLEVNVKDNYFHTGTVKINLNDGNPVTDDEMFRRFEPGMTVNTGFFVKNESTDAVYYKLYLKDVDGELADVLEMSILDGSTILYSGKVSDCTRLGVGSASQTLALNEQKNLTVSFYFPKEAGNVFQDKDLTFVLCADAVQMKNNPDGVFE